MGKLHVTLDANAVVWHVTPVLPPSVKETCFLKSHEGGSMLAMFHSMFRKLEVVQEGLMKKTVTE